MAIVFLSLDLSVLPPSGESPTAPAGPFSPRGEGARRADEGAFLQALAKISRPSPVRPNDLRPRHCGCARGWSGGRGRKSWPHVLSPEGRGEFWAPAECRPSQ